MGVHAAQGDISSDKCVGLSKIHYLWRCIPKCYRILLGILSLTFRYRTNPDILTFGFNQIVHVNANAKPSMHRPNIYKTPNPKCRLFLKIDR
jgi:hypothetical protein